MSEGYYFSFDADKNEKLRHARGVSFELMIALVDMGHVVEVRSHHNQEKYPHQHIIEIDASECTYLVPCVIRNEEIFLKTIYASSRIRKKRQKGQGDV